MKDMISVALLFTARNIIRNFNLSTKTTNQNEALETHFINGHKYQLLRRHPMKKKKIPTKQCEQQLQSVKRYNMQLCTVMSARQVLIHVQLLYAFCLVHSI